MTNRGDAKAYKCTRCQRRYRGHGEWNATVQQGYIRELLCPGCQTPEENAEAAVNETTLNYYRDSMGRLCARSRST